MGRKISISSSSSLYKKGERAGKREVSRLPIIHLNNWELGQETMAGRKKGKFLQLRG